MESRRRIFCRCSYQCLAQIVSNVVSGNEWTDGLGTAILVGGITGALTASGAGALAIGLVAGIGTGTGHQIEQHGLNLDEWNVTELVVDAVVTGVLAGVGSSYGSKEIGASAKQIKNWFKPQHFKTMVTGKFMKKGHKSSCVFNNTRIGVYICFNYKR